MEQQHPTPESLKELGNTAVQNKKFEEAILHYTHAIKLDPKNFALYSNRSFAFLKVHQYYFALEDANETIRLAPNWPKGYFRKAEAEFSAQQYVEACDSYQKALNLKPDDENLSEALLRTKHEIFKEKKADEKIPWLGAGIGLIIGVIIVISDYVFTHKPTHPLLMSFVTIIIAMVGYGIAKTYRYYFKTSKTALLDPPPNLEEEKENGDAKETKTHAPRYTKSQARQRFKKGKL